MVKILFAGMPEMGPHCFNALHNAGKNIVGMIMPPKNNVAVYNVMLNLAQSAGIEILSYEKSMNDPEFIEKVRAKKADIGIVASFNRRFPKALLESTKLGFVNSHPSLLPLYRGGNPYFYPIFNNEKETGITMHFMDEAFDTGDIIFQKSIPILPCETMGTLFNRTNFMFAQAQVDMVTFLEEGNTLNRRPQDTSKNYPEAKMIHEHLGQTRIDWTLDASAIERFIRACNPFLGALSYYKENPVKIHTGFFDEKKTSNKPPGMIVEVDDNHIAIAAGKGLFCPTSMQVGSYFSGDVKMFVDFVKPQVGEMFL